MIHAKFGIGSYTPREAAVLTGLAPGSLKRWLFGYKYRRDDEDRHQDPLWRPQYGVDQEEPVLGFRDLIEARMVGKLRSLGMGLPTIRKCLSTASEIADDSHPFSSAAFRTDGKSLFLKVASESGRDWMIDLKIRQHAFEKVIERSFLDLEFDDEKATRWFLLPKKQTIVADPQRHFGQPIHTESGIPTKRLWQSFLAEGSVSQVADLFEISQSAVRDAVKFHENLAGKIVA